MKNTHTTVSVVILSNDRPSLLKKALTSLAQQTVTPTEVLIVDNSVADRKTDRIASSFAESLRISVIHSEGSIPTARTAGYVHAHGDIVVFLDDDCSADDTYIARIMDHFRTHPRDTAVIGRISNALPENPFASVQFAYYLRGLREFIPDDAASHPLPDPILYDCEVSGIRKSKITAYGFTDRHPRYRNDDTELGIRLLQNGERVCFDPDITASAYPKSTIGTLCDAAFWNGYSDHLTRKAFPKALHDATFPVPFMTWLFGEIRSKIDYPIGKRALYGILLLAFPSVSRIGRIAAYLTNRS